MEFRPYGISNSVAAACKSETAFASSSIGVVLTLVTNTIVLCEVERILSTFYTNALSDKATQHQQAQQCLLLSCKFSEGSSAY
jgi:hypothetical protein